MHLLAAQPGGIADGTEAVDLGQSPGDIVVLSAADSELTLLAGARARIADKNFPSLRLASLLHLGHNMSVDLYAETVIAGARLVVVRLLGGRGYWPYGADELVRASAEKNIKLAFLPGDDQPDAELASLSSVGAEARHRLWQYLVHGGADNAGDFLRYAASLIGFDAEWREPRPLVRAGLYKTGAADADLESVRADWRHDRPIAALVFYRALVQAGNTPVIDALVDGLRAAGLNPLPVFVSSLKDPVAKATLEKVLSDSPPDVVLNATGFATAVPGAARAPTPFEVAGDNGAPPPVVLQIVFAGNSEESWRDGTRGLGARDIAMNVALPEVDGRIIGRAVSFKGLARRDALTETDVVRYRPIADQVDFVCDLAARWATLRRKKQKDRRLAIVLANYPNRDGRLANGVGLDTPAGAVNVMKSLKKSGYRVVGQPADGAALVARLLTGPTNDLGALASRRIEETLSMADYQLFLRGLPAETQDAVCARWGTPEEDPYYRPGAVDCGHFVLPAFTCGNVAVALQPARGYNMDPKSSYHDPALPPPHHYLAFYCWLRESFRADAVVHFGKHGNLEWLPGKALALSAECFPEAALGPMPNLYPFIVNDPGEGTQAKRRIAAVVVDHLTPPLTRAESYGPLRDLEQLVDEYYEASGVDPRRLKVLSRDILDLCRRIGLDRDCGIEKGEGEARALSKLDNYLCELKEMQIRDGLHVFGAAPEGRLLDDTLVALVRVPRDADAAGGESLHRAIARDLRLDFDPLDCESAAKWTGRKPKALSAVLDGTWRSAGDTVERIEALAAKLISGETKPQKSWKATRAVLETVEKTLRPAVAACGSAEIEGLLAGLAGGFVQPGPSGAPTRGRPDVLPTGRNFYSVDTRTVPTPAAWTLGWRSASMLVERHRQDHGQWPRTMALSAWGTANMRTGGDDISQALALVGAKPTWDAASRRVTGFEILPASVLGRPRVDVTLRVSGFFRDAFPALIDLFDSASRAVAALDEDGAVNPLAERVRTETERLIETGVPAGEASRRAGFRVFGSKPGAYGAGLQALIDSHGWESEADLARAYVAWGGYAYGSGAEGEARHALFEQRLAEVEAVVHNQDNREHDLLDSDDYYQFEGGLAVAVTELSGARPAVYHNDHSRPERPQVRALADEIARVVRARVVNPKWIAGVMRHGYKGAFEMAATVDYLFAFQATARCVADHHFDAVFDAYLMDDAVRGFMEDKNPAALREMADKLLEAERRGLWRPRLNSAHQTLATLAAGPPNALKRESSMADAAGERG